MPKLPRLPFTSLLLNVEREALGLRNLLLYFWKEEGKVLGLRYLREIKIIMALFAKQHLSRGGFSFKITGKSIWEKRGLISNYIEKHSTFQWIVNPQTCIQGRMG